MKILIVSPHPDDTELALGAAVHKWCKQGHEVSIAVCAGPGDLNMVHSATTVTFETRREEQQAAARFLGVTELIWLDFAPASKFDTVPIANLVGRFDRIFGDFDRVFIPLSSFNQDHHVVWQASLAAMRPGKADHVDFFAYEQPFGNALPPQAPAFGKAYIAVGRADVMAKSHAVRAHDSQVCSRDNTLYGTAGLEQMAMLRGMESRSIFAEMVYVLRMNLA